MAKYRCKSKPPLALSYSWMLLKDDKILCHQDCYIWLQIKYIVRFVWIGCNISWEILPKWGKWGKWGKFKENNKNGLRKPVNLKDYEKQKFLHDLINQKVTNFCIEGINTVARKVYMQTLKIIHLNILPERQFYFESILPFNSNRNRKHKKAHCTIYYCHFHTLNKWKRLQLVGQKREQCSKIQTRGGGARRMYWI